MIELTDQQREAMANQTNPTLFDSKTQTTHVLIRQETFERIKGLLPDDTELSHDELRSLPAGSMRAKGWDEPGMEEYDNYDEHEK